MYCEDCKKCDKCWDKEKHCEHCGDETDLCGDCRALDDHRCQACHDLPLCEGCGYCLVAADASGEKCPEGDHCIICHEPYVCESCDECFFDARDIFCENCTYCLDCAAAEGLHCRDCYGCFDTEVEECDANPILCWDCCVAEGNHCYICEVHVEEWCDGGPECQHCRECAEDAGWICEECERCKICNDFEFCEECGYCEDCCKMLAEDTGCTCLEYCIESDEFYDPEHMCAQCTVSFSCSDEFCETCGLCRECCEANAADYGCDCGLCAEDSEFEEHLCEICGEAICAKGDFCEDCGLCKECCLERSDAEGCSCGICVESSEFSDPEHVCEGCGEFSCNVSFCDFCGLCEDCCADNAYSYFECSHGVCPEGPDWEDHYCETCEKCKEDCSCGQECCADPWSGKSLSGTATPVGAILIEPSDKTKTVTGGSAYDRAENTAAFQVRAYDPKDNLNYQWYCRRDGGEPQALSDDSLYIDFRDETLVFVGGAQTNKLTVAVPSDACHIRYAYFCVVSDSEGHVLSTTREAQLIGRHAYAWSWTNNTYHQQVCIGEGCGHTASGARKEHEIGPWHYLYYATENKGAKLVRTCNVCGGIAESRETEPLGEVHTTHDYVYTPVEQENGKSVTHIKQCICGRTEGAEEMHTWGEWIVTKQADDHKTGSKYRECLLCNYRETVEIPRQTHEHLFNIHEYDAEFYRVGADRRYHWQYCGDPDCEAVAFKEEHTYSHWFWQTESGAPNLEIRDATVQSYCEVCGYVLEKTVRKGNRPLCFTNADYTVVSADYWDSEEKYTLEVTAKPPVGYYFVRWDDSHSEGGIVYEEYYETYANGEPKRDSDGKIIWKRYNKYQEKVVISLDHYDADDHYLGLNTLYELDAICERYNNDIRVYYKGSRDDYIPFDYGSKVYASTLDDTEPAEDEDWVLWYEKQEEDEYGYRTITVHLKDYDGGTISVENTGLPCNLNIIVDGDSTITAAKGQFGIRGCAAGGNITISSPNNSELRINVSGTTYYSLDSYGIKACKTKKWYEDKITLCGSVHVQMDILNHDGTAYGLYSTSWVEILDDASAEITVRSYNYSEEVPITAVGVYAKKELQLDTTGHLYVYAVVDAGNGAKARGVDAKNTIIDNVGVVSITQPENSKKTFRREPTYDHRSYILEEYGDGNRSFYKNGALVSSDPYKMLSIEPAYPVSFTVAEGATLNVPGVYRNNLGDYMVKPGHSLTFYTAPAAGKYNEVVKAGGKTVKPGASDDGVRTKYVLGPINSAQSVTVSAGTAFKPFAEQPALSQTDVFFGSEAQLSCRMNDCLQALEGHEKFCGTKTETPKFSIHKNEDTDEYESGDLIELGQTINKVFLQRYDEDLARFVNTGISFEPALLAVWTFNDTEKMLSLGEVRYRLMVLYDGMEYTSREFTVNWTDDENDRTEPVAPAVEVYVRNAQLGYGSAVCADGGAWVRLDATHDVLVYDTDTGKGYTTPRQNYVWISNMKDKHVFMAAAFDYHTGTLTFYGDSQSADFDGDGSKEWYNLEELMLALRVPKDAGNGCLTIDVKADTTISGDYNRFGFSGSMDEADHTMGQAAVILNETEKGSVHITSSSKDGAILSLVRYGKAYDKDDAMNYYGIKAADIAIDADVSVWVDIEPPAGSELGWRTGAGRYGLAADGDILVKENASLNVNIPFEEDAEIAGEAVALSSGGNVTLMDSGNVYFYCSASRLEGLEDYYAMYAGGLTVTGSASLTAVTGGDIQTPIRLDADSLWATNGQVDIQSVADWTETYGVFATGCVTVKWPTTVLFEYWNEYGRAGLVKGGSLDFDGDFVRYAYPGTSETAFKESYYPGTPYTVIVDTDRGASSEGAHRVTVSRGGAVLADTYNDYIGNLDVCTGDCVTYTAVDPYSGYTFGGWEVNGDLMPDDLAIEGKSISFTMPDRDVNIHAVYTCDAFTADPPYFVTTNRASTEGTLFWQLETNETLTSVELEYLYDYGGDYQGWVSLADGGDGWYLSDDMQVYTNEHGVKRYAGAQALKLAGSDAEAILLSADAYHDTYRIRAVCETVEQYSQPFTMDFKNGIHVLLSQDKENPGLAIPADYAGTECLINMAQYVYSYNGRMTYALAFGDLSGPVSQDVCEARIYENGMLRFVRNGAHAPIYAIEGGAYVTATDEQSGRSFTIPFDFGEIYDTEVFPVIVGGTKVTERNASDVLGDGTVSYDPETKTLTLSNAAISEIYRNPSDAELTDGAYAIMSVQDITINLVGENVINISRSSFCHSQPFGETFTGTVVGIGNAVNDALRTYLEEDDAFRIRFTGSGSLAIRIDGETEYGEGIHSIGDVTIDGPQISIESRYSGLSSEEGSFTLNSGALSVDTKVRSCIELPNKKARFTVNGGTLILNGGTDSNVIAMSAETVQNADYLQINDGEVTLQTKSKTWDLASRAIYYDGAMYEVLDKNGRNAADQVEAPDTIEMLDYLRFSRRYAIWVNGERFTSANLSIPCGTGRAAYLPELNTVYLYNAEITKGVAYKHDGLQSAAGIHAEQSVNLCVVGGSSIDLSAKDYYTASGEPYTPLDEETEAARMVYGIEAGDLQQHEEPYYFTMFGTSSLAIRGVRYGIESEMPITFDGLRLKISGCDGGITGEMDVRSGQISVDASVYSAYGLWNTEHYDDLHAYGGSDSKHFDPLDMAQVKEAGENGWGYAYPYLWLGSYEYYAFFSAEGISLDKAELSLAVGETAVLTAAIIPEEASGLAIAWTSSDPSIAKVEEGTVTALAEGTATITASCSGFEASCKVTVGHALTHVDAVPATCTEDGASEYWICSSCGRTFSDAGISEVSENSWVIPALGHDFGDWQTVKAATETEEGLEKRVCSRCGAEESRAIPVLSHVHSLIHTAAAAADCLAAGNVEYWTCSGCGRVFADADGTAEIDLADTVVPALGHDFTLSKWVWAEDGSSATAEFVCRRDSAHTHEALAIITSVRTEPTAAKDGSEVFTATVILDGATYTDTKTIVLPATHEETRTLADESSRVIKVTVATDTGLVTVSGDASADAPVLVAAYDEFGRFIGLVALSAPGNAETDEDADTLKIFWIDEDGKPKAEDEEVPME
ncbi:MAG: Ig-like domain-containing protein [Clostridia bacterium]|nr:Ig-like domain-containing protein [Clostridia bacterium]